MRSRALTDAVCLVRRLELTPHKIRAPRKPRAEVRGAVVITHREVVPYGA
jgi:hypothetical protein